MILTQKEIIPILNQLLTTAWHDHQIAFPVTNGQIVTTEFPQFIHSCHDIAIIGEEIQLLLHLPNKTIYYCSWSASINEEQLPIIDLTVRPVTPESHRPVIISPQLTTRFTDYFIKTGRIPNPWKIS